MKKVAGTGIAIVCIVAVIFVLAAFVLGLRRQEIYEKPPLTSQELDQLTQEVRKPQAPPVNKPLPPERTGNSPTGLTSNGQTDPDQLPRRLNRTLTEDERKEWFRVSRGRKFISRIEMSTAGVLAYSLLTGGYDTESELYFLGQMYLNQYNLERAKSCFSELIRRSPRGWGNAYVALATMEDDPELAARYMELACTVDDPFPILWCKSLAEATGSNELAAYYGKLYEQTAAKWQPPGGQKRMP